MMVNGFTFTERGEVGKERRMAGLSVRDGSLEYSATRGPYEVKFNCDDSVNKTLNEALSSGNMVVCLKYEFMENLMRIHLDRL